MSKLTKALTAAAGNAGGESLYVEDVFSTYLYEGNGTATTITNNVDLDGEGGLVWLKDRSQGQSHYLFDTENGANKFLISESTAAISTVTNRGVTAFNSNGFDLGSSAGGNRSGDDYASWTFRKAEKFFDVVTFTSASSGISTVSHNLGSVPACIIVKMTNSTGGWVVYHSGTDATSPQDKLLRLDLTNAVATSSGYFGSTGPTDSEFQVNINNNEPCVAYLFASDAGGFGDDGSESIIKCGSYTGTGSAGLEVDLGFEPQWILIKGATSGAAYDWYLVDNMRGITTGGNDPLLWPNKSDAEDTLSNIISVTATGFKLEGTGWGFNRSSEDYIYIAIRRPMKTPESGTEVFQSLAYTGDGASTRDFDLDLTLDAYFQACRSSSTYDFKNFTTRLTSKGLYTAGTGTEFVTNTSLDVQGGLRATGFENTLNQSGETYIINGFKRATGFFDVVAYTGDGVAGSTQAHNLGVVPECMIVKRRDGASSWITYWDALGATKGQFLDTNQAFTSSSYWNDTAPTATQLTLGSGSTNNSGATFIAYLFATLDGVSKVGSYTGNGTSLNIDCGFSNGARFILIKSSSNEGHWMVFDSERGIVAGNDPQLQLNTTNSESNADWIDPYSAGFTVNNASTNNYFGPNRSGFDYIFLAIA